jgi:hypothetical protein
LQSLRPLLADYQTLDEAFTSRGAQGGEQIPTITTREQYNALSPGQRYRSADGKLREKRR